VITVGLSAKPYGSVIAGSVKLTVLKLIPFSAKVLSSGVVEKTGGKIMVWNVYLMENGKVAVISIIA
jgi:hypothetical protein